MRVGEVTFGTVTLVWEPPLFDGGLPITDHIVTFSKLTLNPHNPKAKAQRELCPAQRLSRWCRADPLCVCSHGGVVEGLQPDTLYVDFSVQCVNAVGSGAVSNSVPSVKTKGTFGGQGFCAHIPLCVRACMCVSVRAGVCVIVCFCNPIRRTHVTDLSAVCPRGEQVVDLCQGLTTCE